MSVMLKSTISAVLILLVSQFQQSSSQNDLSSTTQDAWLYPGRVQLGIHLTFSANADWSDMWKIMTEKGFLTVGKLCVRGAFILYQEPQYAVSKPDAFEVVSGTLRCTMISENTKSAQVIGSMGHMYGPSITFFEKPNFGSEGFSTIINVGSSFFKRMETTRSAILLGRAPWTLLLSSGKSICVEPEFDKAEANPICLIRDFESLLDAHDDEDDDEDDDDSDEDDKTEKSKNTTVFLRASQGCKTVNESSIHRIQDCFYWGRPRKSDGGLVEFEDKSALAGRSDLGGNELCNGGESAKRIFNLYKAVVTKTFASDILVGLDTVGKHAWKLDLLDWMFTIVNDVLPDEIVSIAFLNKVRELFVHKLVTTWNKNDTSELTLSERNYQSLLLLTEQCDTSLLKSSSSDNENSPMASLLSTEFTQMWNSVQTIDDFKGMIHPEFARKPHLDIVTEMVWIVGHMAGYLCHTQFMSKNSYWALYFNTFYHLYMAPIASEWEKSTLGLSLFFGGVDFSVEYNKLAMFGSAIRKKARNMEPLRRPDGVTASLSENDKS